MITIKTVLECSDPSATYSNTFILSYKKENSEQLLVKRDKVNYIKTQVRDYFDTLQVNREDFE